MADGTIIIDTKIDQAGIKEGVSDLKSGVKKGGKIAAAGFAAVAVGAIKLGTELETSLAKASTLYGDVAVETDALKSKIIALSNETGVSATALGDTLYNALSAGIPASEDMSEALGFLEKNAQLAKAGFTDIDTATTATAKVLNAYGMSVEETDRVHKILMQTQNNGITTVGELGGVLANVTPTAAAMGVSFEQVGAALATMTAQGTPAAQATTQLNSLMAELGKEGTAASDTFQEMAGVTFQEFMASGGDLSQAVSLMSGSLEGVDAKALALAETMPKLEDGSLDYAGAMDQVIASDEGVQNSLIDMFGSLEAGKAALAIGGDNAEKYADNLEAMSTEVDVVAEAASKIEATAADKFNTQIETMKNLLIELYDILSPAVDKILEWGAWLSSNPDVLKPILAGIGIIAGLLVAMNVAMAISTGITTAFGIAAGIAGAASSVLAGAIAIITSPVTLVVLAIAALIAIGVLLYKNWDTVVAKAKEMWEGLKVIGGKIAEDFKETFELIKEFGQDVIDFFKGIPDKMAEIGRNIIEGLVGGIKAMAGKVKEGVASIGSDIKDGFKSFFGIKSPSKVMASEIGKPLIQGVAVGLEYNTDAAVDNMRRRLESLSSSIVPDTSIRASITGNQQAYDVGGKIDININGESGLLNVQRIASAVETRIAENIANGDRRLSNKASVIPR